MKKIYLKNTTMHAALAGIALLAGSVTARAQVTQTFSYTGAAQSFTVPNCVSSISVTAFGAQGGSSALTGALGGGVSGVLSVSPGQVLNIYVGGQPTTTLGGFNGGGDGGVSFLNSGAGGGGASDVRLGGIALSNRVIVGGGGGGVGSLTTYNPTGGDGGGGSMCTSPLGYGGGGGSGCSGQAGTPGDCNGGTAVQYGTGGGGGGLNSGGAIAGSGTGAYGAAGTLGLGGAGGSYSIGPNSDGAGGGGGGYYGGAGGMSGSGGCNGGGGGGSSYAGSNLISNATFTSGTRQGNGLVRFVYGFISPGVGVTLSNPYGICPGGTSTITATGGVTYTWSNSSNSNSIVVSPGNTASYTVTATTSGGCVINNVATVTVNPIPTIGVAKSNTTQCIGATTTLTANGANTYTWVGGPTAQTGTSITVNPTVTTSYTVMGLSLANCPSTTNFTVDVFPYLLTTTPNTVVCKGKPITLSASGAASYVWSNGSPFTAITVSPITNTVYSVTSIDVNNCTATNTINVTVNPSPTVTASVNNSVICLGSSAVLTGGGASTYSWSNGGTAATITVTPLANLQFIYTVKGTDAAGCSATATVALKVDLCTGISQVQSEASGISVFPNPGSGLFNITVKSGAQNLKANVYNASGALVKTQVLGADNNSIDLQKESAGVYFIQVTDNDKAVYQSKLIKQ